MRHGKLYLHPLDPNTAPYSTPQLLMELKALGLLGPEMAAPPPLRYLIGERFLQLIIFMGCSPRIELEPPTDGSLDFCHIAVRQASEKIQFISGTNTLPPGCPMCRSRIKAWRSMMAHWEREREGWDWPCPDCRRPIQIEALNWRKSAGIGRFFLQIEGIFPNEAIPIDALMNTLAASTAGGRWGYFYITT